MCSSSIFNVLQIEKAERGSAQLSSDNRELVVVVWFKRGFVRPLLQWGAKKEGERGTLSVPAKGLETKVEARAEVWDHFDSFVREAMEWIVFAVHWNYI